MSFKVLRVKLRAVVIVGLILAAGAAGAQVRYEYTGQKFNQFDFPYYNEDQRVEGWLELEEPLGPYLDVDISSLVLDFQFFDGSQVRVPGNTAVCTMQASTNGSGQIRYVWIELREAPVPDVGEDQQFLNANPDHVGLIKAGDSVCAAPENPPHIEASNYDQPGVWSTPDEIIPQPTTYSYRGQPFSSIDTPNEPGDAINGTITIDGPLPRPINPYAGFDITPYVTSFSFSDGQDEFSDLEGKLCFAVVSTDVWGRIRGWAMEIALHSGSSSQQRILYMEGGWLAFWGPGDVVMSGASSGVCSVNIATQSSIDDPGSWSSDSYPPDEPTEYRYRGEPYDSVAGVGEAGDRGWAFVEFDSQLPANLEFQMLYDEYTNFRFLDKLQIRTPTDSTVCHFRVATDAEGEITQWQINLRESPTPDAGEPQHAFVIRDDGTNSSHIGLTDNDPYACGPLAVTDYQRTESAGTWQVPDPIHGDRFENQSQ